MRSLAAFALTLAAVAVAHRPIARAELTLAGSAGFGLQASPSWGVDAGNLMVTPGYRLLGFLRPELGFAVALEAARQGRPTRAGVELRPMVVIQPPLMPLYLRLVASGVDVFSRRHRTIAYGGALGVEVGLAGLGLFAEAGALPRRVDERFRWVLEGRAGVILSFR